TQAGHHLTLHHHTTHPLPDHRTAAYTHLTHNTTTHAAALHHDPTTATTTAILNALNRTHPNT
ncbi:hypothetical protein AB0G85_16335, partial [Streptomyces sioyaensis]|uniref:hypothetical protein n=1 Tax=Streptomyces sioyaensis TaxID=67364 RepID=UPI0033F9D90E